MPKAPQLINDGSKKKSSSAFHWCVCRCLPSALNPTVPVSVLWFLGSCDEKKLSPHLRQPSPYSPPKHIHTPTPPHIHHVHVCAHTHCTCICIHISPTSHTTVNIMFMHACAQILHPCAHTCTKHRHTRITHLHINTFVSHS